MIASASTLIPAAFPALALAHFLALLSPGPDFFLILGHAVRHRLRGALYICLGIALGNALYICLAVSGWSIMPPAGRFAANAKTGKKKTQGRKDGVRHRPSSVIRRK